MHMRSFRPANSRQLGLTLLLLAIVISVFSAASASPQVYYKLSSAGPLPIGGDVDNFKISPNSMYTVYQAGQDIAEVRELYTVPTDGSAGPIKVSALPAQGQYIEDYLISPNNEYVLYSADQDTKDLIELYSAPLDGSAGPTKISGEMVENGGLRDFTGSFKISPDGSLAVYRAQQDTDEVYELYVVPVDGSADPVKLNSELPEGGGTYSFDITPNNKYLIYTADQDTDNINELYQVPLDGLETPIKLSGELVENGNVSQFKISPDGQYVVYLADQETNDVVELFMAPVDGSALPVKLNGELVENGDVGFGGTFYISPDSQWVVYLADQETNDVDELFSVPITGGEAKKLNPELTPGGDVNWVWDAQISGESSRVVYLADQETDGWDEIFSVPIAGGASVKLNDTLAGNFLYDFLISPDSSRVVYRARQDDPDHYELYSVPLAGGDSDKLNAPLIDEGQVNSFRISGDSSRVVYLADKGGNSGYELYRVPLAGGDVTKVNGTMVDGGQVRRYDLAPDSSSVVYTADQEMDDVEELFQTTLAEPGPVTKLNGELAVGADIWTYEITSNSEYVLYLADHDRLYRNDLYRVRLDGSDDPLRLSQGIAGDYYLWGLEITADDVFAIFDVNVSGQPDGIYSVPIDSSSGPVQLNTTMVPNARVHYFRLSSDSSHVVYRAEEDTAGVWEIYSALVDGSGSQTKLNGELVENGEVHDFQIDPNSVWVVYTADQETDEVVEIYSVLLGGGEPQKLNGPLPENGSVRDNNFSISPDGQWVAYIADQDTQGVDELYLVPIDGSEEPKKISGELVEDGNVAWFQFSPSSDYIVYYATQDDPEHYELYGVSLANPGEATKLNAPLKPGFDIAYFIFSPDSAYLAYLATTGPGPALASVEDRTLAPVHTGQSLDNESEIYSIALPDGEPVKLNQSLDADQWIGYIDYSPDSALMVYSVYTGTIPDKVAAEEKSVLYSIASDFSSESQQINNPSLEGRIIGDYWISSDSAHVYYELYRTPGVYELYNAFIDGSGTPGKITIPLVEGGFVERVRLSPDESRLVYQADQDVIDVEELYASTLPEPIAPPPPPPPDDSAEVYMPVTLR